MVLLWLTTRIGTAKQLCINLVVLIGSPVLWCTLKFRSSYLFKDPFTMSLYEFLFQVMPIAVPTIVLGITLLLIATFDVRRNERSLTRNTIMGLAMCYIMINTVFVSSKFLLYYFTTNDENLSPQVILFLYFLCLRICPLLGVTIKVSIFLWGEHDFWEGFRSMISRTCCRHMLLSKGVYVNIS